MSARPHAMMLASGEEIVELLAHDALVKGAILLVGFVVLAVGLVVVWRVWGRGPHNRG